MKIVAGRTYVLGKWTVLKGRTYYVLWQVELVHTGNAERQKVGQTERQRYIFQAFVMVTLIEMYAVKLIISMILHFYYFFFLKNRNNS
jgi:hypothetical protein